MTLEAALVRLLSDDPAVSSLLGTGQVWLGRVPQDQNVPAVVVSRITTSRDYTHEGRDQLADVLVSVTGWAALYDEAKRLADACRFCMDRSTPGPWSDVDVQVCLVEDEGAVEDNDRRALGYRLSVSVMAIEET